MSSSNQAAKRTAQKMPQAQILMGIHLRELGFSVLKEFRFLPNRNFKFDWADPIVRIAFECDGGQFSGGHMRGKALESQYEKDRLAQVAGWKIFRFTNRSILSGEAREWLRTHLKL